MKLTDLIVESKIKESTGVQSVDELLGSVSPFSTISSDLPVIPEYSEWQTLHDPTRLVRSFTFDKLPKIKYFINEILSYQERINHHSTMTIGTDRVTVETYTHDVNNVTQQDIKLSKFVDEVYEDTRFFLNE